MPGKKAMSAAFGRTSRDAHVPQNVPIGFVVIQLDIVPGGKFRNAAAQRGLYLSQASGIVQECFLKLCSHFRIWKIRFAESRERFPFDVLRQRTQHGDGWIQIREPPERPGISGQAVLQKRVRRLMKGGSRRAHLRHMLIREGFQADKPRLHALLFQFHKFVAVDDVPGTKLPGLAPILHIKSAQNPARIPHAQRPFIGDALHCRLQLIREPHQVRIGQAGRFGRGLVCKQTPGHFVHSAPIPERRIPHV